MIWGAEIAWYLFLAGLGAGAYATAAWLAWKRPEAKMAQRWGRIIAPVVVAIGLVLLMVDASAGIKNPLRFFLLVTNLSSVMAWGVIILSAFMVVAVAGLVLNVAGKRNPRWLDAVGSVLALAVAAYTGVLLGYSVSYPLWNLAVLPFLFVCSAALTGFSFVSAVAYFVARDELQELGFLPKVEAALPALVGLFLVVLLAVTATTGGDAGAVAAAATVQGMLAGSNALVFWLGAVICGIAVPLAAGIVRLRAARHEVTALSFVGYVAACVGGFALRYVIVVAAVGLSIGAAF